MKLNVNKTKGLDGLHPRVLREKFCFNLTTFQKSLDSSWSRQL